MSNDIDNMDELAEEFGEPITFVCGAEIGTCLGWRAKQDQIARRSGSSRLTANQQDLMIFAASLPREPRDGDKLTHDGAEFIVRPRDGVCFTPSDRKGILLRVYTIK